MDFDAAVIGAGVIGLATARALARVIIRRSNG
jgi:glycine/D-amino acid oxidase-like deaminating enzyme